MIQIIDRSFERFRDDEYLLNIIREYDTILGLTIENEKYKIINEQEITIDLSRCSGIDELIRLLDWISTIFDESNSNSMQKIAEFIEKIRHSPKKIW